MLKAIFTPILNFLFPVSDTVDLFETSPNDVLHQLPSAQASDKFECLFAYQNEEVKQLVWEIKYYKNAKVAKHIGKLLAERILTKTKTSETYVLVPIPQTPKRLAERGFNHTELIAHSILQYVPSNFSVSTTSLKKIRHTPKQNSIEHREDRFKNIEGAFSVTAQNIVKNRNIIIIDDVITTGATVGDAMRALAEAHAKHILIFAIAH